MMPLLAQEAGRTLAESRLELGSLSLSDPWFLPGLVLVPLLAWAARERRRAVPARAPLPEADLPRTWRIRWAWVPLALEVLALACGVFALARPLRGEISLTKENEGVDIVLLLDRSTSMEQRQGPRDERRFDVAKRAVQDFAVRRMTDREGASDNVCLVGFAMFTELLCPFTLDADAVTGVLAELDVEVRRDLDGTSIGLGVSEAVRLLENSEAESKVVVVLTDGEETTGLIDPLDAARLASERGVRVYTVFAGPREVSRFDPLTGTRRVIPVKVKLLPAIARLTEARFFHASDEAELEEAYAEIERLERTPRREEQLAEHYDLYRPWVLAALLLFSLGQASRFTWARRTP